MGQRENEGREDGTERELMAVCVGGWGFPAKDAEVWEPGCEVLIRDPWKRPQCWERLKTGGEGDDRG